MSIAKCRNNIAGGGNVAKSKYGEVLFGSLSAMLHNREIVHLKENGVKWRVQSP
jgi:hypothetical protein